MPELRQHGAGDPDEPTALADTDLGDSDDEKRSANRKKARENLLRRTAQRRGHTIRKCAVRYPLAIGYDCWSIDGSEWLSIEDAEALIGQPLAIYQRG